MRIIALINQKGGSGKTTTTVNLGACLAKLGKRVLIIDIDPQAHATVHLGKDLQKLESSIYEVLITGKSLKDVISKTEMDNLELAPSHINLSGAEIELVNMIGRETILKDSINKLKHKYDYILIDCPPSLGLLTLNALTTANEVMIPIQTEYLALEGMSKLVSTIEIVKNRINKDLEITGIIPTMFDSRTNLSREVLNNITGYFKKKVFKTVIRQNISLAEAPSYGKPIIMYNTRSHGSEDYTKLAKEVVRRGG
ncbi:MAG: AAA family ATPase [bacterium]